MSVKKKVWQNEEKQIDSTQICTRSNAETKRTIRGREVYRRRAKRSVRRAPARKPFDLKLFRFVWTEQRTKSGEDQMPRKWS